MPSMEISVAGAGTESDRDGYRYLCRLEEIRQWLKEQLNEEIPPVTEFEQRLSNGVLLVKLGKHLLPNDAIWRKAYDLDEKKFLERGVDFRHTDNINFWLQSLKKLGLPPVFYPQTTDIFERKNMPKLIFCLHALSHFLVSEGRVRTAVPNLEGRAKFNEADISRVTTTLERGNVDVPQFGAVEDLVDEEKQYAAMECFTLTTPEGEVEERIYDTVPKEEEEEEYVLPEGMAPPVPERKSGTRQVTPPSDYAAADSLQEQVKHGLEDEDNEEGPAPPLPPKLEAFAQVDCSGEGITASLYAAVDKKAVREAREALAKQKGQTPQGEAIAAINKALSEKDADALMTALRSPDADLPDVFSEPKEYLDALLAESKAMFPSTVLPVFTGIDREMAEELLSQMSPGAILCRSSRSSPGVYVLSFRNRTGIKHWKVGVTPDGKYFFGNSPKFETISTFVLQFITALEESTGLHVFYGLTQELQPRKDEANKSRMQQVHSEAGVIELERDYIERVVSEVNAKIRKKFQSIMGGSEATPAQSTPAGAGANPPPVPVTKRPTIKRQSTTEWNPQLLTKINRQQAERLLMERGQEGSYVVRISDRGVGQYSISFRLQGQIRHWRVVKDNDKFVVPPNPAPYQSLEALMSVFETVEHAPGIKMKPLTPGNAGTPAGQIQTRPLPEPQQAVPPAEPTSPSKGPPALPPGREHVAVASSGEQSMPRRKMSVRGKGGQKPREWSVDEVTRWLRAVGLGMHAATFNENYIDGECLLELTDDQLKQDLHIGALGHRQQILRKIKVLQS